MGQKKKRAPAGAQGALQQWMSAMKSRKRKRSSSSKVVTGITLTVNQRSKESNDVTREDNDELSTHSTNTDDDDDKGGVFDGTPGVFELQQNPLRETELFQALTMSL